MIEELAFSDSSIEKFTIPSQLFKIKEKWCMGTSKLTHIFVDIQYMTINFSLKNHR